MNKYVTLIVGSIFILCMVFFLKTVSRAPVFKRLEIAQLRPGVMKSEFEVPHAENYKLAVGVPLRVANSLNIKGEAIIATGTDHEVVVPLTMDKLSMGSWLNDMARSCYIIEDRNHILEQTLRTHTKDDRKVSFSVRLDEISVTNASLWLFYSGPINGWLHM